MRKTIAALFFVASIATLQFAYSTGKPFTILGTGKGGGVVNITCTGTCWATVDCSNSFPCNANSSAQTVTNGTNNVILFTTNATHSYQYQDNGGSATAFSNGGTITWTSGHTLSVQVLNLNCGGDTDTIVVKDNVTGVTIGTFVGNNSGIC